MRENAPTQSTFSVANQQAARSGAAGDHPADHIISPTEALANANNNEDLWLVSCRCESAKAVSDLLKCLQHVAFGNVIGQTDQQFSSKTTKRSALSLVQPVTVFCSKQSLTFLASGAAKQTQASVDMQSSLFSEYRVADVDHNVEREDWQSEGEFCINLMSLLDTLNILGGPNIDKSKLCFSYNSTEETLHLELLDDTGVLSTASIPGMLAPNSDPLLSLAQAFRRTPLASRILLKSEILREAMRELELVYGATSGTFSLGKESIEITVVGHVGESTVTIPTMGPHMISLNVPDGPPTARSYPLHSLIGSMYGLEIANETCITINEGGMLAMQHQILDEEVGSGKPSYVDYIMCCLEEDLNSEESQDGECIGGRSAAHATIPQHPEVSSLQNRPRPKPVASQTFEEYDDDDSDAEIDRNASSKPLFGEVTRGAPKLASQHSRTVRQRLRPAFEEEKNASQSMDLRFPTFPHGHQDDMDPPSSPEIVYGRQH